MDPAALANYEWTEIGKLLTNLWIMVGLIVFFATNLIIGHIFIPSLVASSHIPNIAEKSRPAFYAMAILSFAAATYVLFQVIDLSDVLSRIYDDYWI